MPLRGRSGGGSDPANFQITTSRAIASTQNFYKTFIGETPIAPFSLPQRLLVVVPHPDDEVLGTAALIWRARRENRAVRVVFLTNGDGSRTTQVVAKLRRPRDQNSLVAIARRRQTEAIAALGKLNVAPQEARFLGYPDGGLLKIWNGDYSPENPFQSPFTGSQFSPYLNSPTPHAPYCRAAILDDLRNEIENFEPDLVVTTHHLDTHPDHVAAWEVCRAALGNREAKLWEFLVHFGIWPRPNGFHPEREIVPPTKLRNRNWQNLPLENEEIAIKKAALDCYQSQLASTPRYLHAFVRQNELFDMGEP